MQQILEDFIIKTDFGYYCKYGDFYIDPNHPVHTALISHAHGDHAVNGHRIAYCTDFTKKLMELRFGKVTKYTQFTTLDFNKLVSVNGVEVEFFPAGHILGSAQILLTYQGIRYLYTGDYKLQEDPTCEKIEFVDCDVLITETTFANPSVRHPDPILEVQKLNQIDSNILLGCYSLGKAQRMTYLLNQYCEGKEVLVHHKIAPIHLLYQKDGFVPLKYSVYNRMAMKQAVKNKVYIVPPMTFNSYYRATEVKKVFASGWDRLQQHNDVSLYISDHVDWNDILYYIEKTSPRQIWTIHGEGIHLANYLKDQIVVRELYQDSVYKN